MSDEVRAVRKGSPPPLREVLLDDPSVVAVVVIRNTPDGVLSDTYSALLHADFARLLAAMLDGLMAQGQS